MADIRVVGGDQNNEPVTAASVHAGQTGKKNMLVVALANASGDIYNALGAASGGDGAILDGADSGIKATVRNTSGAKPLHVIITNASGDMPNLAPPGGADGSITDGAAPSIKATVKDYANSNPLTVVLVNASGDAYNANDATVTVAKWNLTPGQDSVRIHGGLTGVTGDVSTVPKAGETWPISSAAGLNVREQAKTGVHVSGGQVGITGDVTATNLDIRDLAVSDVVTVGRVTAPVGVSGDVSTKPLAGQTWPVSVAADLNVREQGKTGVHAAGGQVGITGDVNVTATNLDMRDLTPADVVTVGRVTAPVGISGDVSTTPKSGQVWPVQQSGARATAITGDGGVSATVRDYTNANPLAVVATNASGDIQGEPTPPQLISTAGRVTSAGSNSIVAAVSGKRVKVTRYEMQAENDNARAHFANGASGSQLTAKWEFAAREGVVQNQGGGRERAYLFATTAGVALSLELQGQPMTYGVTYFVEDAN